MPLTLISILLPYALKAIEAYIKSSASDKDDAVLDLTKKSCQYLAGKENNTMSYGHVASVGSVQYIREVE